MKKFLKLIPVIFSIGLIIFLSTQTPEVTTTETNWFVAGLAKINGWINHAEVNAQLTFYLVRKFAHSAEYFILGITMAVFFSDSRHNIFFPVFFCALCSISDQIMKIYIPGREFDVTDLPFDVMGYLIGILMVALIVIRRQMRLEKIL